MAAIDQALNNDAAIREERERLKRLQDEWQEKFRQAEVETRAGAGEDRPAARRTGRATPRGGQTIAPNPPATASAADDGRAAGPRTLAGPAGADRGRRTGRR